MLPQDHVSSDAHQRRAAAPSEFTRAPQPPLLDKNVFAVKVEDMTSPADDSSFSDDAADTDLRKPLARARPRKVDMATQRASMRALRHGSKSTRSDFDLAWSQPDLAVTKQIKRSRTPLRRMRVDAKRERSRTPLARRLGGQFVRNNARNSV